jgi:hypothetical protein
MEAGKVIGNVIIFGGIGAMAYLLLKKKPVVEQGATTKKFINGIEESEYNKIMAQNCLRGVDEGKTEILKDCVAKQENTEITEPLIDRSLLTDNPVSIYYTQSGDLKANSCLELDLLIKTENSALVSLYQLASSLPSYNSMIAESKKIISDAEAKFNKFNCRDRIEAVRTKSLVDLQSKGSVKAEESVLGKGFTEQKAYIILGALALLTGFYIVVKK